MKIEQLDLWTLKAIKGRSCFLPSQTINASQSLQLVPLLFKLPPSVLLCLGGSLPSHDGPDSLCSRLSGGIPTIQSKKIKQQTHLGHLWNVPSVVLLVSP